MPATDSLNKPTRMEDHHAMEIEKGSLTNAPCSASLTTVLLTTPPFQTTTTPNFTSETVIENKAVSMASTDCSLALSSPTEASPAKPAVSPATLEGTTKTSSATSHTVSASDFLTCTGTGHVNISEPLPACVSPSSTFGSLTLENDFPAVLTFKGVSVTLENNSVWKQFYSCGTEMILTKQGRRMFPYCRYRLAGLDPERLYSLVLSIVPSDQYRYRWSESKWEITGPAEHQTQGLIRAFSHHNSPCRGSEWMCGLVSFYKLKLTNNTQDQEGHIILHSMHRYIPSLHVIPVPDGDVHTSDQPVVIGPESMTFTFPQTVFMAVTTYQNFRITQLKINHNPFAKGFREVGSNSRLNRVSTEARTLVIETQPSVLKPAELSESTEGVVDLSKEDHTVSASLSTVQETRLVLKPIMSTSTNKDEPYVPCIRGNHALGELVLVQKRPLAEPKKENHAVNVTPELQQGFKVTPKALPMTPTSSSSTPGSLSGYRKRRRRRINRHWANSRGREWKAVAASPTVVHSPSLTVAMQPELDDVEGLLFVSFTTKEALEVHIRDKAANSSSCSSVSPVSLTTPMQLKETVEVIPETDEEKIARLEAILLQDLRALKHRQVIHPVLQEVGLKLSSLDLTKSIDLQYLGVHLPLPLPNLLEQGNATRLSPANKGLLFISRTGKTSDMTKIKGWRNKFIKNKETFTNGDALQKNLSAFCSNMLDEYLESEAKQISERAAAFSTNPEGSVAYELPAKSSSYVKTLDSVLKQRKAVSKFPVGANRPCPLSHKPLLYSALTSPPPPLASPANPDQASMQQSTASQKQPGAENASPESGYTRYHPRVSQKPTVTFGHNQGVAQRPIVLTKFQFKLLQMETGAQNEGLSRTKLTPDRLSVALSVILTKEMLPSQVLKVAQYPKHKVVRPECGQEFCRLGCVCSSLWHPNRGPLHCRRPECMFGCTCFKRKITKQMSVGETEHQTQPVYSMTNIEHAVQPCPGSHANKLWNRNIQDVDPDPLFVPNGPQSLVVSKVLKRSSVTHPTQLIREEDKDPVYKYLESMMTCARVREFNSKPPPVLTIEPNMADTSTANTATKLQKTTTNHLPKQYYRTVSTVKKTAKNTSQESTASESEARKQIQIQSGCEWGMDRKMVLDALCRRLNQNRLSQRFYVGPYSIRPLTKIFMRKPSGSIVTYRVHISKQSNVSDSDEDEFYDSDEEKHTSESFDGDIDAEEEDDQIEDSEVRFGITPFLSGVLPAGRLRATTKPLGSQAYGLIQVNGKSYNQARLLLGSIGSLHPANRLAAYITGRLNAPGKIFHKNSQSPDPTEQNNIQGTPHIKAAGTVVSPVITARKTNDLQTPSQLPVQLFQPETLRKGSVTSQQHSRNSSTINPVQSFVSSPRTSVSHVQNSSMSSPVSLTVSPSLKTPSFLGQSGTYSFRICPPANQSTRDQNLPGVTLPGGFTLIQLPQPGGDKTAKQSESVNTTNITGVGKALPQKDALYNFGQSAAANSDAKLLALDNFNEVKDLPSSGSVEPSSSFEVKCDKKMPSDESDEANSRQVQSNLDITSEDWSSISSDCCGEGDEDEETVDIETVEEVEQRMAIAKMKEAVTKALQQSRGSSDYFGSVRERDLQDEMDNEHDESKGKIKRMNHVVLERQRRSEQRTLFDKLQTVLKSDPRAPRLRLLSLALKEIRNLVETSKYLEQQKKSLIQMQSVYMKQLSLLSGKSEKLIKNKLKEICERQKMREKTMKWRLYFSNLLQSRAALLQAITPEEQLQSTPLLEPDFFMAQPSAMPDTTAALNNVHRVISLLQTNPYKGSAQSNVHTHKPTPHSLHKAESTVSAHVQQKMPGYQAQVTTPNSQSQASTVPATLQITAAPDTASSLSSTSKSLNPSGHSPQPFTLPLIRSKTGRIILPSSLKPTGKGFYTLTFMNPKQNREESELRSSANMQPSDVDSSKNQEKSLSGSEQPSDSKSSHILEEDKTTSSNFDSKPSLTAHLLQHTDTAFLNKSICGTSLAVQAAEKNQEVGTVAGSKKTLAAACLNFRRVRPNPNTVEVELDPNPPVIHRRRGRPRKNPVPPVSDKEKHAIVEETGKSVNENESPVVAEERQSEKIVLEEAKKQVEDTPGMVSEVSDNPVPVKRGRGRPPKKKSQLLSGPVAQAQNSSSKSNEDSPIRVSRSFESPNNKLKTSPAATMLAGDMNTSRPLTRGALGKDFPSAKKRSWIDIEKELDPELEFE